MDNKNPYEPRVSAGQKSSLEDVPNRQYHHWMMFTRFLVAGFFGLLLCGLLICLAAWRFAWWATEGAMYRQSTDILFGYTLALLRFLLPVSFFVSGTAAVTGKFFGSGLYLGFLGSLVTTAAIIIMEIYVGIKTGMMDAIFIFFVSLIPLICCGVLSKKFFAK